MLKWVLGLVLLLLGSELSYAAWLNTNASTRSYRTISSTHNYAIAPELTVSGGLSDGDIIYVAVVGGSDSSDTIVSPTYDIKDILIANTLDVTAVDPDKWGESTFGPKLVSLNAVLKITLKSGATVGNVQAFLRNLRLQTMAYRQDKTIAFILDRTSATPTWRCFNARTVSVNFNIQCSTTHGTHAGNDGDNDIAAQDLVSFSPNEFLAFDDSGTERVTNGCAFSAHEKELHSTHQTMATYSVNTTQLLSYVSKAFSLADHSASNACDGKKEYTTANQADDTRNTIYARMVIMRPNPFLHAQPF